MNSEKQICIICLEENNLIAIKCGHRFCLKCINDWKKINNSCPCCRVSLLENTTIDKIKLDSIIRKFPIEMYFYGMKVTPSKYLSTFYDSCINSCHNIIITKPYGVLLTCNTCNKSKSYNWMDR